MKANVHRRKLVSAEGKRFFPWEAELTLTALVDSGPFLDPPQPPISLA